MYLSGLVAQSVRASAAGPCRVLDVTGSSPALLVYFYQSHPPLFCEFALLFSLLVLLQGNNECRRVKIRRNKKTLANLKRVRDECVAPAGFRTQQ